MKLGVFITTHMVPKTRHAGRLDGILMKYFRYMLNNYENLLTGLPDG